MTTQKISIVNKCRSVFEPVMIEINGNSFMLKRSETRDLELPAGSYELVVRQYWLSGRTKIDAGDTEIVIKKRRNSKKSRRSRKRINARSIFSLSAK